MTSTKKPRIGWIGTGVMGAPMCGHILDQGYPVTVYSRTKEKARGLLDGGAKWADSSKAVAGKSDIIFTIVGFPPDVREVYFGDDGILAGVKEGSITVDMTTTEPSLAEEIAAAVKEKGASAVDAPVSGGDVGAKKGTLSIMIGGEKDAVERVRPLFELLGKNIVYEGPAGSGQHTKMCNQIVIAGTMIGVCESLLYGYKAGLDLETMLEAISGGAAGCWTLNNLAPRILRRNFDPGFFVDHFIKDMGIALDEAKRLGISLPSLALVHQLYLAVKAQGHGKLGTHALMLALEKMSHLEVEEG
jgi:3-hydroxyisobutyrate dehydrogenase